MSYGRTADLRPPTSSWPPGTSTTCQVMILEDPRRSGGWWSFCRAAFPDLRFVIEDEVVADDKVVVRWTAVGTHLGDYDGISAVLDGPRSCHWTGIDIVRLQDHRIVELWGNNDGLGFEAQFRS